MFKALQWEDWVGVALGAWLAVSPWVLGFSDNTMATTNALFMGTVLVFEEFLQPDVHLDFEEWVDMIAGAWLVVSPFVLGFSTRTVATFDTMIVGFLTVAFAACAISPVHARLSDWARTLRTR